MNYENPKSDMHGTKKSKGASAGVKDGLSSVMPCDDLDMGQRTKGGDQKPCPTSGSGGAQAGKTFTWK